MSSDTHQAWDVTLLYKIDLRRLGMGRLFFLFEYKYGKIINNVL